MMIEGKVYVNSKELKIGILEYVRKLYSQEKFPNIFFIGNAVRILSPDVVMDLEVQQFDEEIERDV